MIRTFNRAEAMALTVPTELVAFRGTPVIISEEVDDVPAYDGVMPGVIADVDRRQVQVSYPAGTFNLRWIWRKEKSNPSAAVDLSSPFGRYAVVLWAAEGERCEHWTGDAWTGNGWSDPDADNRDCHACVWHQGIVRKPADLLDYLRLPDWQAAAVLWASVERMRRGLGPVRGVAGSRATTTAIGFAILDGEGDAMTITLEVPRG